MDLNVDTASTTIGGVVGVLVAIAFGLKKMVTAWKTESLEAAKVDSLSEVVAMLTEQLQELRRANKELREINDNLSEDNRQLKKEINRLSDKLDELSRMLPDYQWDGVTERRNKNDA